MGKQFISEQELIQLTSENVRSFYSRDKSHNTAPMADNFMWIGSNDFQWCEGLDEFLRVTSNEYEEPPVTLSDEEYHLLLHDHNVWVVYGRYKATAILEDGSVIHAHVRGTYVWKRVGNELQLVHTHGSHAQDIPLNHLPITPKKLTEDAPFFDYMKQIDKLNSDTNKVTFREKDGMFRYLNITEILYLKASNQNCIVYTLDGSFEANGLLSELTENLPAQFQRIHRSYTINRAYITSLCRYQITLTNGQELPVSKARYMEIKKELSLLKQ